MRISFFQTRPSLRLGLVNAARIRVDTVSIFLEFAWLLLKFSRFLVKIGVQGDAAGGYFLTFATLQIFMQIFAYF